MTQPTDWQLPMRPGNLESLDLRECVRLLASRPVGRLAYCGPFGPRIVPLNHTVVGEGLLFRTSPDSDAAREIPHHWVAFEVDDLDDFLQAGWSVQVQGFAELLPLESLRLLDLPQTPQPWAAGDRPLVVRIPLTNVTGRRVHAT
jgi:uncharacterized protein